MRVVANKYDLTILEVEGERGLRLEGVLFSELHEHGVDDGKDRSEEGEHTQHDDPDPPPPDCAGATSLTAMASLLGFVEVRLNHFEVKVGIH